MPVKSLRLGKGPEPVKKAHACEVSHQQRPHILRSRLENTQGAAPSCRQPWSQRGTKVNQPTVRHARNLTTTDIMDTSSYMRGFPSQKCSHNRQAKHLSAIHAA